MRTQNISCCSLVADGVVKLSEEKQQQISHDLQFDGGRVIQFHLGVLSTYSYLLCSCDAAMLIDPGRDVNRYEEYLFENNIQLCGVFLTHIHTDYVSGHLEAGERFNVPIFLSRTAEASFSHIPLDNDTNFSLGRLKLHFFATPGHSAECFSMTVGTQAGHPEMVFVGDALQGALSDDSGMDWIKKIEHLEENTRFYPAHELEGTDKNWTTWGKTRHASTVSQPDEHHALHHHKLHLETLRDLNRKGPELVDWENVFPLSEPGISLAEPNARVVDIRNNADYAKKHIPYSLNIESNGKLEYWTALLFSLPGEITLVGDNIMELTDTAQRLLAVGCKANGFLFEDWEEKKLPILSSENVDVHTLDTQMWSDEPPFILDVRSPGEWQKSRLSGSINIPLLELKQRLNELPHDRDIVIVCASGFRSAIAVGILETGRFRKVSNLSGGLAAWLEAGKSLNSKQPQTPVPSKTGIN